MTRVYLDNAATTALDPRVLDAMMPYMTEHYGNPSAIHAYGRNTRIAIENARKTVAKAIGASTGEIFFTSGGTEANNTALKCAIKEYGVTEIISSPLEHHCVLHTLEELAAQGIKCTQVEVDKLGRVVYDDLRAKLAKAPKGKVLVTLMHANNEIGTTINLNTVSALCEEFGAFFHTDTVQTIGHLPIDVSKTKIHFLSGSGHKLHGPKGCGFLYINADVSICPLLHGGGQERNMRAGTENLYGIVGLGKAIELAVENMEEEQQHITGLKTYMMQKLQEIVPGISFNGDTSEGNLYTVLNCLFPKQDAVGMFIYQLDIAGIAASAGSACSSGSNLGSHVLSAIGVQPGHPSIRFSFSRMTTKAEIDFALDKVAEVTGNVVPA